MDLTEENGLSVDTDELELLLMQPAYRDKRLFVVSVAGPYRRGKSFLLNYFIRYLTHYGQPSPTAFGDENEPLVGFPWGGGYKRITSGLHVWSQPFLFRIENGEDVVILLVDTEVPPVLIDPNWSYYSREPRTYGAR